MVSSFNKTPIWSRERSCREGWVVRDPKLHESVINDITKWIELEINMNILGVIESPILGPSGNKEFLIVAKKI